MNDSTAIRREAIRFFHYRREQQLDPTDKKRRDAVLDEDFKRWIEDIECQNAYEEIENDWQILADLSAVEYSELQDYDSRHKASGAVKQKKRHLKMIRIMISVAIADLLLSVIFPPLSLLEPFVIGVLIYHTAKYFQISKRLNQKNSQ